MVNVSDTLPAPETAESLQWNEVPAQRQVAVEKQLNSNVGNARSLIAMLLARFKGAPDAIKKVARMVHTASL